MDVYERCPVYENELVRLRLLAREDAAALLGCYGDPLAAPFFNDDNCSGSFVCADLHAMQQAVDGWLWCYERKDFVRFAIEDQATGRAVGTVEMFHCELTDRSNAYGVLRVDVSSPYETRTFLAAILALCTAHFYADFGVAEMVTKAWPDAVERLAALEAFGFEPTGFRTFAHYQRRLG